MSRRQCFLDSLPAKIPAPLYGITHPFLPLPSPCGGERGRASFSRLSTFDQTAPTLLGILYLPCRHDGEISRKTDMSLWASSGPVRAVKTMLNRPCGYVHDRMAIR